MADKSPNKPSAKKPGMSLKEKRAAKKMKHGSPGITGGTTRTSKPGSA